MNQNTGPEGERFGAFDYIVIGAGTAGCLLANRLSADPAIRVLLLEAGGEDNYLWIKIPIGYLKTMNNPRTDWCLKTESDPGLNGRSLNYPRGRVLGGCSAINGMIYMRGQARDYDQWRQMGNAGWGWDDVLPYFKKHEDFAPGGARRPNQGSGANDAGGSFGLGASAPDADEMHGVGGEWRVEDIRLRWEILEAFRDACAEVGIPKIDDFNRGNNEGSSYFQVNQKGGVRWTAAHGFLHPVRNRANLAVLTGAEVETLAFDGRRATAVVFRHGGTVRHALVSGEIILASGAIGSPKILQLSGIGPGDFLRGRGIPVRHELPGVGENLQDHLQIRCAFKVHNTRTLNELTHSLWAKLGMGLEYILFRSGPLTMAPSQLGVFAKSDPGRETPNLEYHVQPLTLNKFGDPLDPFPAFTASVCNIRPTSRGTVRIKSRDPGDPPAIRPNYLSTPEDRLVAADAIRLTRRIVATKALARFAPEEFRPGPDVTGDEDLARAAGDIGTTIFHPVSTCKMGPDPMAVVDERLRVRGLAGLRVIDASVMPTITSGNTNSPTLMIAEKGAAMVLQDRRAT
ncbi:MAG: GMC family oxidoreductase N-terminal domain-containing protein [Rhodospirillales bacterium]|nr:GMC family oxidoreductase N-terminal domain-containing protein [Rhodospirillales bacterium]